MLKFFQHEINSLVYLIGVSPVKHICNYFTVLIDRFYRPAVTDRQNLLFFYKYIFTIFPIVEFAKINFAFSTFFIPKHCLRIWRLKAGKISISRYPVLISAEAF